MKLEILIETWQSELTDIKDALYNLGGEADSLRYNLLATEALRLSMCINDLHEWRVEDATK